jgi:hypothetical protein
MLRTFQNPHRTPVRLRLVSGQEQIVAPGAVAEVEMPDEHPCPQILNEITPGREVSTWDTSWLTPEPEPAPPPFVRRPAPAPEVAAEPAKES